MNISRPPDLPPLILAALDIERTTGQIGRKVGVSTQTLWPVLRRLEKDGLVQRRGGQFGRGKRPARWSIPMEVP